MADKLFTPTTGAADWATAGNWSPSGVPTNGDRAIIRSGTATITAGSSQAAITLAELVIWDTFTGSLDIAIGYDLARIGVPSGGTTGATGSGKILLNAGTVASVTFVYTTGNSTEATSGQSSFRWKGTHATGNKLYVLGGSVAVGADYATAVLNDLDVQNGTVIIGPNVTTKTVTQSNGVLRHNGQSDASGSISTTGGTLYTGGTSIIPTLTVGGGTTFAAHRAASGDSCTSVEVLGGATLDLTDDPRDFDTANPIALRRGGKLNAFSSGQVSAGISWPDNASISIGTP